MNAVNPIQSPTSPGAGGAEPSMEEILASIRRIIADDGATPRLNGPRDHGRDAEDRGADDRHADDHHAEDRDTHETESDATEPGPTVGLHPPHLPPEVEQALEPLLHEAMESELHDASVHRPARRKPALPESESEHDSAAPRSPSPEGPMGETTADFSKHPLAPASGVMGPGSVVHDELVHDEPVHDEPLLERPIAHHDSPATEPLPAPERLFSSAAGSSVAAAFNTLAASRFVDNSEQLTGLVREMIHPLVKSWVEENLPGMVERLVVDEIERMVRGGR